MDAERFDTLRRSLVASSTRRRLLGGLASVLGAGIPLEETVDARKKHRHKRRR